MKKLTVLVSLSALLALSACGGSDHNNDSGNGGGTVVTPTPPVSVVDSFYTAVLALIGIKNETSEPVSTDALVATKPETTEPEPQS